MFPRTIAAILNLLLERCHPLLQMELKSLVGLCEEPVHRVRQTLVVLFIHLLSLSSLEAVKETIEELYFKVISTDFF